MLFLPYLMGERSPVWDARASGAFDASYQEFTQGAAKTVQGIEGMATFLDKASEALRTTDEQLASQLGS